MIPLREPTPIPLRDILLGRIGAAIDNWDYEGSVNDICDVVLDAVMPTLRSAEDLDALDVGRAILDPRGIVWTKVAYGTITEWSNGAKVGEHQIHDAADMVDGDGPFLLIPTAL